MKDNILPAIIVDDEFHARENLRMLLQDYCPRVRVIDQAATVDEALLAIQKHPVQLLFLDIRMPSGAEGFELLERLPDRNFQVIFVTAFKDYALKAFKANAVDYILKPVDPDELQRAVEKALLRTEAFLNHPEEAAEYRQLLSSLGEQGAKPWPERIAVTKNRGFRVVPVGDIVRLEASGNHTYLFLRDGSRLLDSRTLGSYEELLDPLRFMRVHKSHTINLSDVREYRSDDGHIAIMSDKAEVPVARSRAQDFTDFFQR